MKKLNKLNKDNKKIKIKQLGKPLTGKFLALVIKNEIVNNKYPKEEVAS